MGEEAKSYSQLPTSIKADQKNGCFTLVGLSGGRGTAGKAGMPIILLLIIFTSPLMIDNWAFCKAIALLGAVGKRL